MIPLRISKLTVVAALLMLGSGLSASSASAIEVEVLTRGPVHEAFAETVTFNPQPGVVVTRECPAPIEEMPPELKPEGANVSWVPGYWAWDDDRNNFLWISGVWRDLPYGRQWVPGYWHVCESGYQWTAGYWADAQQTELDYLPEAPPQTVEAGPIDTAPSPDYAWMPGIWVWRNQHYSWRPGFWAMSQPGWTWIPDRYIWSPRGYLFVNGYWDYSLDRRGTLFAPVCFNTTVYAGSGYVYSPTIVIGTESFAENLFLRPNYCHYYFGDYYAVNYDRAGFYPCFAYHEQHGYDPIFVHERWEHRRDNNWERTVMREFRNRREHEELRPPRTFALQQSLVGRGRAGNRNFVMAVPLRQFAASKTGSMRFLPVTKIEAKHFATLAVKVQDTRQERLRHESKLLTAPARIGNERGPSPERIRPLHNERPLTKPLDRAAAPTITREHELSAINRERLPHSPIVSKTPAHLSKAYIPPKAHTAPNPDLKMEWKAGHTVTPHPTTRFVPQHGETRPIKPMPKPGVISEEKKKI